MHANGAAYNPEYDFLSGRDLSIDFMIATMPRSGSTFFSSTLWSTGGLGAPLEYLNLMVNENRITAGFNGDICAYWDSIISRRTSPNGVFGWKMFTRNYIEIAEKYPSLMKRLSPKYVIFLDRRDEAEHAVSYWRAIETQAWFAEAPEKKQLSYEAAGIRGAEILLRNQRLAWEKILELTDANPIRVFYEDVLSTPQAEVGRVASLMQVDLSSTQRLLTVVPPNIQRNNTTLAWAERYRNEIS